MIYARLNSSSRKRELVQSWDVQVRSDRNGFQVVLNINGTDYNKSVPAHQPYANVADAEARADELNNVWLQAIADGILIEVIIEDL